MLLIIPGIIAFYNYSFTFFVMTDNPKLNSLQAIKQSKKLAKGRKFDIFLLQYFFVLWKLLVNALLVNAVAMIKSNFIIIPKILTESILANQVALGAIIAYALGFFILFFIQFETTAFAVLYEDCKNGLVPKKNSFLKGILNGVPFLFPEIASCPAYYYYRKTKEERHE